MKPLAFDLFAGAGGASTGLVAAGYDVIGFELDKLAAASHQANGHPTIVCDLNTWPWLDDCTVPDPDLLWASPPCTPFSAAGNHAGHLDPRDGMPAMLRAVRTLLPPVLVMENVPGLLYKKHRWYLDNAVATLEGYGYTVDYRVLNSADYGVPQTRKRLILIARIDGKPIVWPTPTHAKVPGLLGELPWVTMAEALGWGFTERPSTTIVRGSQGGGGMDFCGGQGTRNSVKKAQDDGVWADVRVGFARKGDNLGPQTADGYRERDTRPITEPAQHVTEKARSWTLHTNRDQRPDGTRQTINTEDLPAPTFSTKSGAQWTLRTTPMPHATVRGLDEPAPTMAFGHEPPSWVQERPATTINGDPRVSVPGHHDANESGSQQKGAIKITPEQAACLQGFPEGYRFLGSRTAQFRQIGNAAPAPLVTAIVTALL